MFECDELHQCVSCQRLLSKGDKPDEVRCRLSRDYANESPTVSTWVCGECIRRDAA